MVHIAGAVSLRHEWVVLLGVALVLTYMEIANYAGNVRIPVIRPNRIALKRSAESMRSFAIYITNNLTAEKVAMVKSMSDRATLALTVLH